MHAKKDLIQIDLPDLQEPGQCRCRLQFQLLPEKSAGIRAETVIKYLPRIQEIRDKKFIAHLRFKPVQTDRKAFNIVLAVFQQPVCPINKNMIRDLRPDIIHADRYTAGPEKTPC